MKLPRDESGSENAEFRDMDGNLLAYGQNFTSAWQADSSRYIDFDQPDSQTFAEHHVQVLAPVKHDNIVGTSFSNNAMEVFRLEDGNYWVDVYEVDEYINATGQVLFSHSVDRSASASLICNDTGTKVEKLTDNTIVWSQIGILGFRQYAVNENGLTVEMDSTGGALLFHLHFMDQVTGKFKYDAEMQPISASTCKIHFTNLSTPDVIISYCYNDDMTEVTYNYEQTLITNAASTNGRVMFKTVNDTDPFINGNILSTTYTHD